MTGSTSSATRRWRTSSRCWATARVVYRGTPLVLSEAPALPQVHLESTDGGAKASLEFRLPEGEPVGLREAVFLVGKRTSFLLSGQTLYSVRPHLPPRLWRKWLLEPSMSLPHGQLDRALTFFAAHLPRLDLSLRADGLEVDESTPPHFLLTLEGSAERVKAQLSARYGGTTVTVSPSPGTLGYAIGSLGNKRRLYRRDEAQERAALKLLSAQGLRWDGESYVATGDTAVSFWASGLKALPADWERFAAVLPEVKIRSGLKPRVRVGMEGLHWFELDARFESEGQGVDLGAVRLWLASGRKYVPLQDGSFAEADREEVQRATELLEEAGAAPGKATTRVPLYQAMALDALASLGDAADIEARARAAMAELRLVDEAAPVPPPNGLQATLRHYQEAGLAWLWFLHRHRLNGILADDMGLGKTVQALALLLKSQQEEKRAPSLVVAPTSVLANWKREAERFTPGLEVVLWHGQDRRSRQETFADVDIVLTSYALIRRDLEELSKTKWRYVVLDEAQNIKNAGSATAQACKALPAEHRLALTGTPLENRLGELWSIFDFLMPGFLGSEEDFSERYEQPIQVAADMAVRERLRRRIHPFILRRLKTEVAKDLPAKTEVVAWCEMDAGQQALYREVLEQSRNKVHESIDKVGFARARVSILAALMRLRQVCCDPRLLKLPPGTQLPPRPSWSASSAWWMTWWPRGTGLSSSANSRRCSTSSKPKPTPGGSSTRPWTDAPATAWRGWTPSTRPTGRPSSSSASRPAGRASTSPRRTTCCTSTPGGIRRWKTRPRTAPTALGRRAPSSATSSLPKARWRRKFSSSSAASASSPRASWKARKAGSRP